MVESSDGATVAVDRLRVASAAVTSLVAAAESHSADAEMSRLIGMNEIVPALATLVSEARHSVWVLQPQYFFDPEDPGFEMARTLQRRGVSIQLITRPTTLQRHPLLPSLFPITRVAPVFVGSIVVDETALLVGGSDSGDGERTSWLSRRADVVAAVCSLWRATWAASVPVIADGATPPLSPRQVRVARMLALGEKDLAIARALGMSSRTVERDVATILAQLGARNRTEAVLVMRGGRGVNGRGFV